MQLFVAGLYKQCQLAVQLRTCDAISGKISTCVSICPSIHCRHLGPCWLPLLPPDPWYATSFLPLRLSLYSHTMLPYMDSIL